MDNSKLKEHLKALAGDVEVSIFRECLELIEYYEGKIIMEDIIIDKLEKELIIKETEIEYLHEQLRDIKSRF